MLRLGELRNAKGATKNRKRLGRGSGSGQGQTAGKGNKGQLARTGGRVRAGFEGGQMPLFRRLPKKGFTNIFRTEYVVINVGDLQDVSDAEITLATLKASGVLKTSRKLLKVLGNGDVKKALNLKVNAISQSAKEKIEKAGGKVEVVRQ